MSAEADEEFAQCVGAEEAIAQERRHINRVLGKVSGMRPDDEGRACAALSLSGGGIRSASICMGFIQALAEQRLLHSLTMPLLYREADMHLVGGVHLFIGRRKSYGLRPSRLSKRIPLA